MVVLLEELTDAHAHDGISGSLLTEMCVDTLGVAGVGISLMTAGEHRGLFGASNATAGALEELQFTLGEGPCVDAWNSGVPVLEPDLANPAVLRWPAFSGPAVQAGARAVFGFPLRAGEECVGAMDLCAGEPQNLSPQQMTDAVIMSRVVADALLLMQTDAPADSLADELIPALDHRAVVHQATGMISAQLDLDVDTALVRLRAYSYTHEIPVNDVARDVVDRRLKFS